MIVYIDNQADRFIQDEFSLESPARKAEIKQYFLSMLDIYDHWQIAKFKTRIKFS